MSEKSNLSEMLELTTEIVAAHVGNNPVPASELPTLIQDVYKTLASVGTVQAPSEKLKPAVPVKRSVFPDYIVCLEDGKKLKMLKRHLKTSYNMTPEEYRERWGLPPNIPWWPRTTPSTAAPWRRKSASAHHVAARPAKEHNRQQRSRRGACRLREPSFTAGACKAGRNHGSPITN